MADPSLPERAVAPVRRLVAAMVTGDPAALTELFTADAVILDSFAPYVFEGRDGVTRWFADFRRHTADHVDLRAALGDPQEPGGDDTAAFFSQPITWTFGLDGRHVVETGGLAVLMVCDAGTWRIRRTAWAVVTVAVSGGAVSGGGGS